MLHPAGCFYLPFLFLSTSGNSPKFPSRCEPRPVDDAQGVSLPKAVYLFSGSPRRLSAFQRAKKGALGVAGGKRVPPLWATKCTRPGDPPRWRPSPDRNPSYHVNQSTFAWSKGQKRKPKSHLCAQDSPTSGCIWFCLSHLPIRQQDP